MPEYDLEPFPGPDGSLIETTDLVRERHVDEWDAGLASRASSGATAGGAARSRPARSSDSTRGVTGARSPGPSTTPDLPPDHRYYDYQLAKQSVLPYLQETWRFSDRVTLLAGLSMASHRYRMDQDRLDGVAFTETFSYPLPASA